MRASKVQRAACGKIRELLLQLDRALAPEIVEVRLDLCLDREQARGDAFAFVARGGVPRRAAKDLLQGALAIVRLWIRSWNELRSDATRLRKRAPTSPRESAMTASTSRAEWEDATSWRADSEVHDAHAVVVPCVGL